MSPSSVFVPGKLPGIRLVSIELEVRRQPSSENTQPLQKLIVRGLAGYLQLTSVRNGDLNIVALLQFQRLDNGCRKTNRKAVAPFCDLGGRSAPPASRPAAARANVGTGRAARAAPPS